MNLFKKLLLSLILVLTMFTSVLNVNYVKAEGDEEQTHIIENSEEETLQILTEDKESETSGDESSSETTYTLTKENDGLNIELLDKDRNAFSDDNKLTEGDSLKIHLKFNSPKVETGTKQPDVLIIDFGTCGQLTNITGGNITKDSDTTKDIVVGEFKVVEVTKEDTTTKQVEVRFKWDVLKENWPNESQFTWNIYMDAKAELGDDPEINDGEATITIGDFAISVPYKKADSTLNINKESLGDGEVTTSGDGNEITNDNIKIIGDTYYKKFKVTVKSVGDKNTYVVIKDTLSSKYLSYVNIDNEDLQPTLTIASESKGLTSSNFVISKNNDKESLEVSIGDLNKDETAVLTYWVSFSKDNFDSVNNQSNSVLASFTNNNGDAKTTDFSKYTFKFSNIGLEKTPIKDETYTEEGKRKINWTIKITGGDMNDGYIVTDSETLNDGTENAFNRLLTKASEQVTLTRSNDSSKKWVVDYYQYSSGTIQLTGNSSEETSNIESVDSSYSSDNPIKIYLSKDEVLNIEYSNIYDISSVSVEKGFNTVNTVTVKRGSGESASSLSEVGKYTFIPGRMWSIEKKHIKYDPVTNTITWQVTVKVPEEYTNVTLFDKPDNNLSDISGLTFKNNTTGSFSSVDKDGYYSYSFVEEGDNVNYTVQPYTDNFGNAYNVRVYTATYTTKLNRGKTVSSHIKNKAKIKYTYNEQEYWSSEKENLDDDYTLLLSKNGSLDSDYQTSGKQNWEITINTEVLDFTSDKKFILTESLPDNLEIIADSLKLDNKEISLLKENQSGTVTLDLTDVLKEYEGKTSVKLSYKTKFIDYSKSLESKSYENKVKATYGNEIDEASHSLDTLFVPNKVLTKEIAKYDSIKAKELNYTVTVNPSGIKILNNDQDELVLTDKLGKDLRYDLSSIKIINTNTNEAITDYKLSVETDEGTNKSIMTIKGLPDQTPLKISYTCLIYLPQGTNTTNNSNVDVSNDISFNGLDGISFEKDTNWSGTVNSASGSGYPTNTRITFIKVNKDDSTERLSGAKFEVKMVKLENGKFRDLTPEEIANTSYNGPFITEPTNDNGETSINLLYDEYYYYKEISSPDAYDVNDTFEGYVLFDGEHMRSDVSSVPEDVNFTRVYNFIGKVEIICEDNKSTTADITIKKVIDGDTDILQDKSLVNSISFYLKDNTTGDIKTIKLSEFDYDKENNVYSYIVSDQMIGHQYTIEETIGEVIGYIFDGSSFSIKDEKGNSINSNTFTLDWKNVEATFTNTYKYKEYSITISKLDSDTKELLSDANLELYKGDTLVEEITTSAKLSSLSLTKGIYTLKEVYAPKGYELADDITFEVNKDGSIKDIEGNNIEMIDNHITKDITLKIKVNGVSYHSLKNLKFKITNKTNGIVKEVSMLDEFEYDKELGIYLYTFKGNMYHEYLIEEVSNTLSGYNLKVNNIESSFDVEDKDISIEFINTYEKIEDKTVVTCEDYMKSKDWTWSEKTKTCVYKVGNTSSR